MAPIALVCSRDGREFFQGSTIMNRGWTKRWRKRWDKGYHKNHLLWVLMDYMIDFAAYEPKDIYKKNIGLVHLERGEWAFTERSLSEFFSVDRQCIRTCLVLLEKMEFLTRKVTHKITHIKVINYETYQDNLNETNPQIEQVLTQSKPSPNPAFITKNKRIKELERKELGGNAKRRCQLTPDYPLSGKMIEYAAKNGINGNRVHDVFESFRDYHLAKGTVMLDWDAAWRTWIRNDKKFQAGRFGQAQTQNKPRKMFNAEEYWKRANEMDKNSKPDI